MATKVVLAISGGVDSSVSAYLLKKQGYEVEAVFMKNWDEDDGTEFCTAKQDYADAKNICDTLNIKLNLVNFSSEYYDEVFEDFLQEIKAGNTPNPDVFCNQKIKFGTLWEYAQSLGADYLATGHYAKIKQTNGGYGLFCAEDKNKDQSYFLYAINEKCLKSTLFPLGNIEKTEVRKIANQLNLINAKKKDSTGICFIGERNFSNFLNRYLKSEYGNIVNLDNQEIIGKHRGLIHYTIGQRKGIGIGGNQINSPWYVVQKSNQTNTLFVVQGENHPALYKQKLVAHNLNWLADIKINTPYTAKIRYRQAPQNCKIIKMDNKEIEVVFDKPQRAITTGQALVIYNDEQCLGGGTILKV